MREILFRGQTRRKGEYIINMAGDKCESHWVYGGIFPQNKDGDFTIIYQQEPEIRKFTVYADTVGQYTGLVVANGKVFDGDYLKFGAYILEVFWNGETFQWQAGKVGRSYDTPFRCCGNYRDDKWTVIDLGEIAAEPIITGQMTTEIVGNRWDNPELIPQKSKCEWDLF